MSSITLQTPVEPQTNFTTLPREIRDEIYHLTLTYSNDIWWPANRFKPGEIFRWALHRYHLELQYARDTRRKPGTGFCLLFTKASNAQVVNEAQEIFFWKNHFMFEGYWASEFLNELKCVPAMRLIQNVTWRISDHHLHNEVPSIFHHICSASTAMRLRTVTVIVSSKQPRHTRENVEQVLGNIVSAFDKLPALGNGLQFSFDLDCDICCFKQKYDLERVRGLSKGISEDEFRSICVPHSAGNMMEYFIAHNEY